MNPPAQSPGLEAFAFDAFVTAALFDAGAAVFALGDGTVRWQDGVVREAHEGAVLCAAAHPSGEGVLTGGDDGKLVWSRREGCETLAAVKGWVDAVAVSPVQGLIAFASGRQVRVRDARDASFERVFDHPASVGALAFEGRGRRLAAASYGGVALWFARIADQKPVMLRWAGSHLAVAFSPDGRFVVSGMQEPAAHGWRLSDGRDMNMGGYPARPKTLAFVDGGAWLATSGAPGAILWPFAGANGPMGKQGAEIGFEPGSMVARVAGELASPLLAAGLEDGRVWAADLRTQQRHEIRTERAAPVSALAVLPSGGSGGARVAFGDEAGRAGVAAIEPG
ncbi:MAG TPA: WD40 repeat domain-containing protein [Caulobacteraceae bacterium]|jgi:WD40 repeat protein|nr:WD40 repeat domain-containing protein [Caulobacteraceae bacterium]